MATTLPALVGNYLNTHHMWLIHADSDLYDGAKLPEEYFIAPELPFEAKIERCAEVVSLLARRLAVVDEQFPRLDIHSFKPHRYFGFPQELGSLFSCIQHEGRELYIKVDPDLLVPEFREAEGYWVKEYFPAFHRAYPNEVVLEKTRRFLGSRVRVVEEGGEKFMLSEDGREKCSDWEDRLLKEIGPEMKRRLAAATEVLQGCTARLFERNDLNFISQSCTLDEQWRQSLRRDFHGTLEEFMAALPNLYDRELFKKLEEYPTLAMERSFPLG